MDSLIEKNLLTMQKISIAVTLKLPKKRRGSVDIHCDAQTKTFFLTVVTVRVHLGELPSKIYIDMNLKLYHCVQVTISQCVVIQDE